MAEHQYALDVWNNHNVVRDYIDAYRQGTEMRNAEDQASQQKNYLATLRDNYAPAMSGDETAINRIGALNPEMASKMRSEIQQMQTDKLTRGLQSWNIGGALLKDVRPGDDAGLERVKQQLAQMGVGQDVIGMITHDNAQQFVHLSPLVQQEMKAELDRRIGEANIRQSDASAAASNANAARIKAGPDPLDPESMKYAAEIYNQTGQMPPLGQGKEGSLARREILRIAAGLAASNGGASGTVANFAGFAGTKAGLRTLGGRQANIDTAAAEAGNFAQQAVDASAALPRGGFVPLTRLVQAGQVATSDPRLAYFATKAIGLAGAAATVAGRGTTNQFLQEEYLNRLSTAQSPEAFAETARAIIEEAKGVSESTQGVRNDMLDNLRGQSERPRSSTGGKPGQNIPPAPPGGPAQNQSSGGLVTPPMGAIQMLRTNPQLAPAFDQKYGPGAAKRFGAAR